MSRYSKIALLLSGFALVVVVGTRYILGGWIPILYVFVVLWAIGMIVSVILDYKMYWDFLTMKTTRSGISLGASLGFMLVFLIAIGFLSNKFNKTLDFTQEGLNSLSLQSKEILSNLKSPARIYIFYNGDKMTERSRRIRDDIQNTLTLYKQTSSKIKVRLVDSYVENDLATKYLSNLLDKNRTEIFVFVDYEGRSVRLDEPFTESSITSGLIKVKKRDTRTIHFLVGHGERDLKNESPGGLKVFNQYLNESGFSFQEWSFLQDGKPKKDPDLILIIGPRRPFLQSELQWLKSYLSRGGKVFFAVDPGERHGLQSFFLSYGIEYKNNFIINQIGTFFGRGLATAMGLDFNPQNPITKKFINKGRDVAFFDRASVVSYQDDKKDFQFQTLVSTHSRSFSTPVLSKEIEVGLMSSLSLAVEVRPALKEEEVHKEEDHSKEDHFRLVVFGDSDFLSNKSFYDGVNRDLALNVTMSLLDQEDLVTIRPKGPKGTKIHLSSVHRSFIVILVILVPLIFAFLSGFVWYRRREA